MKEQIDALFSKEMSRKEFLQHVGSAVLIVFGIGSLLGALQSKPRHHEQSMGYGTSAYGGVKR